MTRDLSIHRDLLGPRAQDPELLAELEDLRYTRAPPFLGTFGFWSGPVLPSDLQGGPDEARQSEVLREVARLGALAAATPFNRVFVQRYNREGVRPHRDPKNNLGCTVIGLYGSGWGTTFWDHDASRSWQQAPGDVFVLPCTDPETKIQGPKHSVTWGFGIGVRYAIILNWIEERRA